MNEHDRLRETEDAQDREKAGRSLERRVRRHDPRDECVKHLIMGLTTDGSHHKQWYLEQAFRALCEDAYVEKARIEFPWETGIP